jgi:hypothetical protein
MKLFLPFFLLFLSVFSLDAQTAGEMDALLETRTLTYAQAARFILPAAGAAAENISTETAFHTAVSKGWLPETASAGDIARLDRVALLLMKAFDLQGGLFYRLFPNSRYAYRELAYKRIIQGEADSAMPLSGEDFFRILGRTMDVVENTGAETGGELKK